MPVALFKKIYLKKGKFVTSPCFCFTEILAREDELDERALDALKELDEASSLGVCKQFAESDLSHVNNKSAFLCGVIKAYRTKSRMKSGGPSTAEAKGPDEAKIKVGARSLLFTDLYSVFIKCFIAVTPVLYMLCF